MPSFFRKDEPGYWERYPSHLSDMSEMMVQAKLSPSTLHVMGREDDETAPAAMIFTMPPHSTIPRHAHLCERFEIILEGSLIVEDCILGPGDVMIARAGEQYGPHTAGPDGCRTLEVFSTLAGAHHQIQETPEGTLSIEFGSFEALRQLGASIEG